MRQDGSYKTQRPNMIQVRGITQEGIINNVLACTSAASVCNTGNTATTVVTTLPQGINSQTSQLHPSLRAPLTTATINTSQPTVGLLAASNVTSSSHVIHSHNDHQVRQILVSNPVNLPKVTDGLVTFVDAQQRQQQHQQPHQQMHHLQLHSQSQPHHQQQQPQQQHQHQHHQQPLLQHHHQSSYPTRLQTLDIDSESVSVQATIAPTVIPSQNIILNTLSSVSSNNQHNLNSILLPVTQEQQQLQHQSQPQQQISLTQSQLWEMLGIERVCATSRTVVTDDQQETLHQQQQQISQLQHQHNLQQQQLLSNHSTNVNVTDPNSPIQNTLRDTLLSSSIVSMSNNLTLSSSLVSPVVSQVPAFQMGNSEKSRKPSVKSRLIDNNTMLNKLLDTTKEVAPIKPIRPDLVHQVPSVTVKPMIPNNIQSSNGGISNTNGSSNNITANTISICESNNFHKIVNTTQLNSRNPSNNISTISLPRPVNSMLSDTLENVSGTLSSSNIDNLSLLPSNFNLNSNSLLLNQSQLSQQKQFDTLQQVLLGSGTTSQLTDAQISSAAADTMRLIASLSDITGSDSVLATISQLNDNKGVKKFATSATNNNRGFSNLESSIKPISSIDIGRNSSEAHNKASLITSSDPMFPSTIVSSACTSPSSLTSFGSTATRVVSQHDTNTKVRAMLASDPMFLSTVVSSTCSSPSSMTSFGSTATRVVSQQDTNTKVRAMLADPKVSQLSLAELLNKGSGADSLLGSNLSLPIMSLSESRHTGDVLLSELHRSDESDLSLGASLTGATGEDLHRDSLVTETSLGNTISGDTAPLQGLPSPPLHTFSLPNMSSDFMVSGVSGGKNSLPGPLPALLSNLATTSDLDQFQFLDNSNMGIDMSSLSESEVSLSNTPSGFPLSISPGKSKKTSTNSSSELNFTNALKAAKSDTEQVRAKLELETSSNSVNNSVPVSQGMLQNMQLKSEFTLKPAILSENKSIIAPAPLLKESKSQIIEISPPRKKSSQRLPKITKNVSSLKQSSGREKKKREKHIKNELLVQQVACFKCRLCSFLSQDNGEMLNHMKFNHSVEMSDSEGESDENSLSPDSKRLCRDSAIDSKGPKDILFGPPSTRMGTDLDSSDDTISSSIMSNKRSIKKHSVDDPEYKLNSFMIEPEVFKKQTVKIEKEETGFEMLLQEEIEEKAHVKVFVETHDQLRNLADQNGYDEDEDTNDSSTTNDSGSTVPSIQSIGAGRPPNAKSLGITKLIKSEGKGSERIGIRCDIGGCGLRMKCEPNINYHRKCHKERMLQCPECRTNFGVWRDLSIHLWRQHCIDMELHKCDLCNYKSYSLSKLMNIHYKVHSDERPSLCETCGKRFKTAKQLRNHKALHIRKNEVPALMCDTCQRPFSDRRMLRNHMESVHKKVKPFLCNYCGYSTASKSTLKMHMRQHTGEKPFACEKCTYRTADHNSLRRHKMQHTGVRPYQCPYCSYASIQSSTFKVHLKDKHPGLAQMDGIMFQCGLCNFKTVKRDNYLAHVAEHNKAECKKQRILSQQRLHQQTNESKEINEQGVSLRGETVSTAHVVNIDVNSGAVTVESPHNHPHQFINSALVQGQLPNQVVLSGGEQYIYATVDSSMLSQVSSGANEGVVHLSPSVVAVPMTMSLQTSGSPQTILPNIVYVTSTNQDPDDPARTIGI